jgi:hypothetical protein
LKTQKYNKVFKSGTYFMATLPPRRLPVLRQLHAIFRCRFRVPVAALLEEALRVEQVGEDGFQAKYPYC